MLFARTTSALDRLADALRRANATWHGEEMLTWDQITEAEREEWRRVSVSRDLCIGTVQGKGAEGYREALALLKETLDS